MTQAAAIKEGYASPAGWSWRDLSRGVLRRIAEDELFTRAAALSFYFIFALFPMAFSLLALLGIFARDQNVHRAVRQLGNIMPPSALILVEQTIAELSAYSTGWKLLLGLGLALWSGSGGMSCIMDALNRSHRVRESRPLWQRQIIALGLTALISALTVAALSLMLVGGNLAALMAERSGLSRTTVLLWELVEWSLALFFMLFSLNLIYCLGPASRQRWRWITLGSIVGVLVWVSASLLFRLYVHFFSTYSRSYGSLGAVMVLLFWLYISGLAILLGGEINGEVAAERAAH